MEVLLKDFDFDNERNFVFSGGTNVEPQYIPTLRNKMYASQVIPSIGAGHYNYQSNVGKYIDNKSSNRISIDSQYAAYTATCLKLAERDGISDELRDKYLREAKENIRENVAINHQDNKATEAEMKKDRHHSKFETIVGGCLATAGIFCALKSVHDDYEDGCIRCCF